MLVWSVLLRIGGGPGQSVFRAALASTSGHYNTTVGNQSGAGNTTGPYNALLEGASGVQNTSGSANVFLAMNAGYNNTTGSVTPVAKASNVTTQ